MLKAVEMALSVEAKTAKPLEPVLNGQPEERSGRGGRRPGSGAKPSTIQGLLKGLPSKRAKRLRKDISAAVVEEIKSIAWAASRKKPGRGRKPEARTATKVTQLKDEVGLSWGELTNKMNSEARSRGLEERTEDGYRSLYRTRKKRLAEGSRGGRRPGAGAKLGSKYLRPLVKVPASDTVTPG